MKKVFLLLISLMCSINLALADVYPTYINSVSHWGLGVAQVAQKVYIYESDNEKSTIIEAIAWDNLGHFVHQDRSSLSAQEAFVVFIPAENMAFFTVDDENDDWIRICYDQKRQKFGWIKKASGHKVYFWQDFFSTFGKKYGVYPFRDLDKNLKKLYAQPSANSQAISSFDYVKHISPWLIRGNWMLMKITNYDDSTKMGWFRWRDDYGRLFGFVSFKHEY